MCCEFLKNEDELHQRSARKGMQVQILSVQNLFALFIEKNLS